MIDEALRTAPTLSPAEAAVSYILQRIRVDANLRYHMLHTEAFGRLCAADALRTGKTEEEAMTTYSTPAEHCRNDKPQLIELRNGIEKAINLMSDGHTSSARDVLERLT